ncbi:HlyD family type I secretion periplasmic adaptor subunit [Opitutaceae bacterium]|nr:HlyD family type I secretion periplasmic adaptor subunit [Opitutaceae bacterium]
MSNNKDPKDGPNAPEGKVQPGDLDFIADCKAAFLEEKMPYANVLLLTVVGVVSAFLLWAYHSRVSELTRGQGKIIPSGSTQIVQSLEGGILSDLFVSESSFVKKGQVLAKLDDTAILSPYRESLIERDNLVAKIVRLDAESQELDDVRFPKYLEESNADLVTSETLLFQTRRDQINTNQERLQRSLDLKSRELSITKPLAESGVVSRVELLRLETMVNDLEGQLEREKSEYLNEVVSQNNEYKTKLNQIEQSILAFEDRVSRTDIKAPLSGIVNKIHVKTLGGVLQPGAPIMEIVPIEDSLLVEAKISPSDIAFVKLEQEATVKLTAYDYSIYGGLEGKVARISADTFLNEEDGQSYYQILIRAGDRSLKTTAERFEILPGMVAQVDIKTGKKSVLDYLLKPLMRAKMNAFTER